SEAASCGRSEKGSSRPTRTISRPRMNGGVTPSAVCTGWSGVVTGPGPGGGVVGPGLGAVAQAAIKAAKLTATVVFRLGAASVRADDLAEAMNNPSSNPEKNARERIGARESSPPLEAGLYVVATPIGSLRDITLRALDILATPSRVSAEDTRVALPLVGAYGPPATLGAS